MWLMILTHYVIFFLCGLLNLQPLIPILTTHTLMVTLATTNLFFLALCSSHAIFVKLLLSLPSMTILTSSKCFMMLFSDCTMDYIVVTWVDWCVMLFLLGTPLIPAYYTYSWKWYVLYLRLQCHTTNTSLLLISL